MKVFLRLLSYLLIGLPIWTQLAVATLIRVIKRPKALEDKRAQALKSKSVQHPDVPGVQHEIINVGSETVPVRLHVARAGVDPSKTLLVFLHGWPEFWYSWRAQIAAFQESYEIAAFDLPGFNASEKLPRREMYVTQNICAFIAAGVDKLGRNECVVIGHDWGSVIAADLAALYPEKVQKLVCVAVPPGPLFTMNMDLVQSMKSLYMTSFQAPYLTELSLRLEDYKVVRSALVEPPMGLRRGTLPPADIEAYKNAMAMPGALTGGLNYYRAMLLDGGVYHKNRRVAQAWRQPFSKPAMVVVGDSDGAVKPNCLGKVGEVLTKCEVHMLPNCSHWVQQDAAADFNMLLDAFLRDESLATKS